MKKCTECAYFGKKWLLNASLEVFCPNCKTLMPDRFIEKLYDRKLSYMEAVTLYDRYEDRFLWRPANTKTSWEELDVVLNESISRKIRSLALSGQDKLA